MSDQTAAATPQKRLMWVPLESNPELFTSWCSSMGLDTSKFAFHDIYGTDPDLLAMVPQPVSAVLLLFPLTEEMAKLRHDENASASPDDPSSGILWFKQTIGNACGTIGLLHALANSDATSSIKPGSPLDTLFQKARATSDANERADVLVNSKELQTVHEATASQGQSQAPEDLDNVLLHFICFVRSKDGELVELDGSSGRKGPMPRGKKVQTQEDLLPVAVEFVKDHYMALNPNEVNFNLIALGPSFD
ncbi:ubiquitin C-terminal hydrolase UCHL1 [Moesziomyces antarcticus T-34]|uniref:Ubiquitin carboxyl-terminal hydrolase n=1 Tax=Pseudozyma antarctica (strain T-34) TaxID=1151754 RepID=M9M781_PSEA3|nr:ubiquitin C-terminal hydrolase UCHL1 [Moesziomyces antarcticus T-34]